MQLIHHKTHSMKHKAILSNHLPVYLIQCILIALISATVSAADKIEPFITEAYHLRMSGKAEQAEQLLRQSLKTDSANAYAWFELARTRNHIFLGQGQFSPEGWTEVLNCAEKSVKLDPDDEVLAFYYAYCRLTDAFISLMQGKEDARDKTEAAAESFRSVLRINPRCFVAQLYLIDIYGVLPEDMGGDKAIARTIAGEMKSQQAVYQAMGQARLMPDTADMVQFWQKVGNEAGMNSQVMEELGRAYLLISDTENGKKYFHDAVQSDPSKKYLTMNLVRYYLMRSQQDQANKDMYLQSAVELANSYIQSDPQPIPPLKAHAYSILAMISMFSNNQEEGNKYNEMAAAIDPYCSKATGMPSDLLYSPPDQVKISYSSFFMPF